MKKIFYYLTLLGTFLVLTSCVYFNTLYNAKVLFRDAHKIELRENGKPTSQANSKYNKAMKKCGYIITEYKNSKYADDALYLLAQCFFYKQNYTQAKSRLDDLIKYYPKSEFITKAKVLRAQSFYRLKDKEKAFAILQELLASQKYVEEHPHIYILLADYYLEEKSIVKAEFYLAQLIEKFPKSKERQEAITTLVKTYIEAESYADAIAMAQKVIKSRSKRNLKLDAMYYEAYCYLLLEQYDKLPKKLKKLLKKESRKIERAKVQILQGRMYAALENYDEAITILGKVKKENRKKLVAAESAFRIGEIYFYQLHNYEKAIEFFTEVKSENKKSEYYSESLAKSAIASQIHEFKSTDSEIKSDQIVEQSFKLAEHYYGTLNMPDSAMVVYDNIELQYERLIAKSDSIKTWIDSLKAEVSSNSLDRYFAEQKKVLTDTIPENDAIIDSTFLTRESNYNEWSKQIQSFNTDLEKYRSQYLPFTNYLKLWVSMNLLKSDSLSTSILEKMIVEYPENSYTYAASKLYLDEEPELINVQEENERNDYLKAVQIHDKFPQKAIALIDSLIPAINVEINLKANLLAGNIYYYDLKDTLAAKPYFDVILESDTEFRDYVSTIYSGGKFNFYDRLNYFVQKDLKAHQDSLAQQDSLKQEDVDIEDLQSEEIIKEETSKSIEDDKGGKPIERSKLIETDRG